MTVKPVNQTLESMDSVQFDQSLVGQRKDVFTKMRTEEVAVEADQESGASSTEEAEQESPKSVAKFGGKNTSKFVHSQVFRVKKEELFLREHVDGEACLINIKERKKGNSYEVSYLNVVVFSRPILPCSPLSGKKRAATSLLQASH